MAGILPEIPTIVAEAGRRALRRRRREDGMLLAHAGHARALDPSARAAPDATMCGDVAVAEFRLA